MYYNILQDTNQIKLLNIFVCANNIFWFPFHHYTTNYIKTEYQKTFEFYSSKLTWKLCRIIKSDVLIKINFLSSILMFTSFKINTFFPLLFTKFQLDIWLFKCNLIWKTLWNILKLTFSVTIHQLKQWLLPIFLVTSP